MSQQSPRPVRILILLTTVSLILLESCSTPITVGPDHFGVGLYRAQHCKINPDVDYREVEGMGVLFTPGRASLGYAKHLLVSARLDNRSYSVSTPLADFAVGAAAEDTGIDFVFGTNPNKFTKGKPYE